MEITTKPIELSDVNIDFGDTDPMMVADLHPFKLTQEESPQSIWDRFKQIKYTYEQKDNPIQTIKKQDYSSDYDLTLPDILQQEGFKFRISSGYRPNAKTNKGRKSNHSIQGGAYDIVPYDGNFEEFEKQAYANPRVRNWLQEHGWGTIDEYKPEIMKQNGSTGKHIHFGPDTAAKETGRKYGITYAQEGIKLELYSNPNPDTPDYIEPDTEYEDEIKDLQIKMIDSILNSLNDDFTLTTPDIEQENKSIPWIKPGYFDNSQNITGNIRDAIKNTTDDVEEQQLLYKIAQKESTLNANAKNPKSSAKGLFQFTDATAKQYGWDSSLQGQVNAAHRLYVDRKAQLGNWTGLYGSRGKTFAQLMYGMWWNPKAVETFLKTGKNTTIGGISLNDIFNKMA